MNNHVEIAFLEGEITRFVSKSLNPKSKNIFDKIYNNLNIKSKVIYDFIDDNIRLLVNENLDIQLNNKTIGWVGRLTYIKRFDLCIKVHKKVLDMGIYNDLIIVGDGKRKVFIK